MIAALVFLFASAGAVPATPSGVAPDTASVRAAIVDAVRARIDEQADVEVSELVVNARGATVGKLVATPEPDARLRGNERNKITPPPATPTWPRPAAP